MWIIVGITVLVFIYVSVIDFINYKRINHYKPYVSQSLLGFSMNLEPVFDNGLSKGFFNISNQTTIQIMVEIREFDETHKYYSKTISSVENSDLEKLDETIVYSSKTINPGDRIEVDSLNLALSRGKYTCNARLFVIDDFGECSLADSFKVLLTILN